MIPAGDALEDYARLLQLSGIAPNFSFSVRPLSVDQLYGRLESDARHPWQAGVERYRAPIGKRWRFGVFEPEARAFWNSARPAGQNDGAVWQGRGATFALTAGGYAKAWFLSAALRPRLVYTQNRAFDLWPGTTFRQYPQRPNIDLPQRMGLEPFATFDPGDSYVRLDVAGVAAGFSNENMWWGPAMRNGVIMSNNAPGFPHLFVGTSGPTDVWIGKLQMRWLWGRLFESGYYEDARKRTDRRFITGAVLDFEPRGLDGLSLGLTRVFVRGIYQGRDSLSYHDYLIVFQGPFKVFLGGSHDRWGFDEYDQLASAYARWAFPESGFEVYGEYARGDHSGDARDFIVQLQHGGGYTVGLQKLFQRSANAWWRAQLEMTRLEAPRTVLARAGSQANFFYTNTIVRQGYTQRGQVIGAGIGPGSNSQYLGLDYFTGWGRAGAFLQRVAYDNDRYHAQPDASNNGHEVEFASGLRGRVFYRGFEIEGVLSVARLLNRHYIFKNDQTNVQATLSIRHSVMGYR